MPVRIGWEKVCDGVFAIILRSSKPGFRLRGMPPTAPAPSIHVFVDNSNIFGGAQRAAKRIEPTVPWPAIRVYYRNLFSIIEGGRRTTTRVMGGSVPPGNEDLWKHAQAGGYSTDLLSRIQDASGRLLEQAVDEVLHLQMALVLLDHAPGTLVLVTGDGAVSDYRTSFTGVAQRALRLGWAVEVWSWKSQLSPAFSRLPTPPGSLSIIELEPYYKSITFVKGGNYSMQDGQIAVSERVVAPPPRRV